MNEQHLLEMLWECSKSCNIQAEIFASQENYRENLLFVTLTHSNIDFQKQVLSYLKEVINQPTVRAHICEAYSKLITQQYEEFYQKGNELLCFVGAVNGLPEQMLQSVDLG